MPTWNSIRDAIRLVSRRDRRTLYAYVGWQSALAILDLVALALLGLVAVLASRGEGEEPDHGVDRLLTQLGLKDLEPLDLALILAGAAAVLMVTKSIASFLVMRRVFNFLAERQAIISTDLSSKLLSRPLLEIQLRSTQDVAFALTMGVSAVTLGIIGPFTIFVSELALIIVLGAGLMFVDLPVTVFTVLFFAAVGLGISRLVGRWAEDLGVRSSATQISSLESVQEILGSYREMSVAGRRSTYLDQFRLLRWEFAAIQADLLIVHQATKYVFEIALVIGGALLALSQFLTKDVGAAAATVAIFLTATSRIMPSLIRMQGAALRIRSQAGVADPALSLAASLRGATSADWASLGNEMAGRILVGIREGFPDFDGSIRCEEVTFGYPGSGQPAVAEVSLYVPRATSVALVGSTGAGKSTLADLMVGVLRPDSGRILLNGVQPQEAALKWPGACAYVAQDTSLANGDIASNVALGLPPSLVDEDRVWEALERAQLARFVRGQPEGIRSLVGENGLRLSGGQRQRLGIARALYTRPKLIVLDEATSALDAETEDAVTGTLRELGGKATVVIVAHRLGTIREVDQVVFLEEGRVRAIGSFDDVRAQVDAFDRHARLLGL